MGMGTCSGMGSGMGSGMDSVSGMRIGNGMWGRLGLASRGAEDESMAGRRLPLREAAAARGGCDEADASWGQAAGGGDAGADAPQGGYGGADAPRVACSSKGSS